MHGIKAVGKKFAHTFTGIAHATVADTSFRAQLIVGGIGIALVWYFGRPLSELDLVLMALATLLVLITELQNSAIESALDKLHPGESTRIGRSKDMAGGAVLLAAIFALVVAVVVIWF